MTQSKSPTAILGVFSRALSFMAAILLSTIINNSAFADTGSRNHREQAVVATAASLDLDALTSKLLETQGIGLFAKLDLQHRFNALLDDISLYHQGLGSQKPTDLRRRFNRIILQIIALLQEGDPALRNELVASRDIIWQAINAPKKAD